MDNLKSSTFLWNYQISYIFMTLIYLWSFHIVFLSNSNLPHFSRTFFWNNQIYHIFMIKWNISYFWSFSYLPHFSDQLKYLTFFWSMQDYHLFSDKLNQITHIFLINTRLSLFTDQLKSPTLFFSMQDHHILLINFVSHIF